MRICIQYHVRLSEIIRLLPLAQHLAKQKHEVFFETLPAYESIFDCVDYCRWQDPKRKGRPQDDGAPFEVVFPLTINPRFTSKYRTDNPAPKFWDFIVGMSPKDFKNAPREIRFSKIPEVEATRAKYHLPAKYSLLCMTGFSYAQQRGFCDLVPIGFEMMFTWARGLEIAGELPQPMYLIGPGGFAPNPSLRPLTVSHLPDVAALCKGAAGVATINGTVSAICSAFVGSERIREKWHHVSPLDPRERSQDDIIAKGQARWEVSFASICPSIVPQNAR